MRRNLIASFQRERTASRQTLVAKTGIVFRVAFSRILRVAPLDFSWVFLAKKMFRKKKRPERGRRSVTKLRRTVDENRSNDRDRQPLVRIIKTNTIDAIILRRVKHVFEGEASSPDSFIHFDFTESVSLKREHARLFETTTTRGRESWVACIFYALMFRRRRCAPILYLYTDDNVESP